MKIMPGGNSRSTYAVYKMCSSLIRGKAFLPYELQKE